MDLQRHPLPEAIVSIADLRVFVEQHVFVVWDFMLLLKALQQHLAPSGVPWVPPRHPRSAGLINSLVAEEGNDSLKLRVFVTGGGCSGFQYGFAFDEEVNDDDTVIENKGAELIVDPLSYQYLVGATIDYVEGLEGSRFTVNNPMASTTCGCGASFSI